MFHSSPIPRTGLARCAILILFFGGLAGASAQSVDYEAMEQLFGEPVTTSVTGKPQRAADAPANIEIITQDEIRRSGATSIPDVLRFITGIDVRNSAIASSEVGIRGYNQPANPRLMVLINGHQFYMVDFGRVIWSLLPVQLEEIRQIEVIKGPNSALYGFNAVGGVINIITYDPSRDKVNATVLRTGTQDYRYGAAIATLGTGDTAGFRLSAGGFRSWDFAAESLGSADRRIRRPPFSGTIGVDGRWRISPRTEVFFDGSLGSARLSAPTIAASFDTEQTRQYSARAGLRAETPLGIVSLAAWRNHRSIDSILSSSPPLEDFSLRAAETVTAAEINDLVKIGADHTLRGALEFRENSSDLGQFGKLTDTIYAASLMWDWQILPAVTTTSAVRIDYLRAGENAVPFPIAGLVPGNFNPIRIVAPSFNWGLVWKAGGQDTFRLSIARGVQLPSLLAQELRINYGTLGPLALFGNPGLLPSIVWNTELDYDRALPAIDSILRVAVFAQRTDNVISNPTSGAVTFVPPGLPTLISANAGYSTAAGLEAAIKGHSSSGWRWSLSYALADTSDHTSLSASGRVVGTALYTHSVPAHVLLAGLGYSRGRWEADLAARWQSFFRDVRFGTGPLPTQTTNVNNYLTLNARAGFRLTENLTAALTVRQINEARLTTTAGAPMERQVIVTITGNF